MRKVHYAWYVCVGCALLLFCTSGLAINAFTIYQPYIISLNHFTNTRASALLTFRNLASLLSMLFAGSYYKRLNMRCGMTIAGGTMTAAYVFFGISCKYWHYCIASILTGIGYGLGTMIPITILLNRWFERKKDTAIGICSAVTGVATLGIPSLLSSMIESKGLCFTFLIEAIVIGLFSLICFCLLRNSPEEMQLCPYGSEEKQVVSAKEKLCAGNNLSKPELALMLLMILFIGGVMNVSYSHLTVFITGEGLSSRAAALALSISGIALLAGKILYGKLEDRLGTIKCNFVFAPLFLSGLALCCFIGKLPSVLFPAVTLYSFGLAYMSVGLSTWPLELSYGEKQARMIQLFQIGYAAGGLVFSPLPGAIADGANGSYQKAYILFFVLGCIVFFTVQFILFRKKKQTLH